MTAGFLVVAQASLLAQVATEPSGFITLDIHGTGGVGSSALSFIALGMTRPVEFRGTMESAGSFTVTDNQATWVDNQFNGNNGLYFLELASGTHAGLMTDIVATTAATKSLTVADDLSGIVLGGETYKIRKHWTLASVFGSADESGLGGGNSTTADEILIYDPVQSVYATYYYRTIAPVGWRSSADAFTDQAGAKIELTKGIIIKRKQTSDLGVKLFGDVKLGYTAARIQTGVNIVANVYCTDTLTLGNSGLYTGDPVNGVAGGTSVTGDQVLLYNGTGYATYYFKTNTLGGAGWRSISDFFTDAANTIIPHGTSVVIQRTGGRQGFYWYAIQPF
ncbi:MAG: TIGR02597 family protein [Verrucomicrobia bacterium]|nr:TIGR02597 family protein [Verrucomicrobiota bacterium]